MPLHKIEKMLSFAENEKTFFERIRKYHSVYSPEYRMIERAYDNALNAFSETYRDGGQPYFTHVRAVAIILIEYLHIYERADLIYAPHELLITGMLHDNPEDRPDIWPLSRVARDYNENVALLSDYISKRPKAEFGGNEEKQLAFYHNRFSTAPKDVFIIKLSDRLHNQLTLWSCDEQKIRRKMQETQDIYLPLARKWGILVHELEATIDSFEDRLKQHLQKCAIL
ncbi:MAG: HD domain-containing protein [Parcubacteria group bacterium]|jgi:(p)ppGpp synthase/HD superfamily hydrolase